MKNVVFDRYEIKREIRKGRTATVYLANDQHLDRDVAIKYIKGVKNNNALSIEAKREIRFLTELSHENIINIYDTRIDEDNIALVLPYIDDSLDRIINSYESYNREFIINIANQISEGVDYCAQNNISHRDLKPSNILVNNNGKVKIIDFGISANHTEHEVWNLLAGTRPYIPPESILNPNYEFLGMSDLEGTSQSRHQYDQFSFGVLLYELLTRKLPFSADNENENINDVDNSDTNNIGDNTCTSLRLLNGHNFIPCHDIDSNIPSQVNDVIIKMMSIHPQDRYSTNLEASRNFREALLGNIMGSHSVFISYSSTDMSDIMDTCNILAAKGLTIWRDESILTGDVWADKIEQAMLEADTMIVFLSESSCNSNEVRNEWNYWIDILKKPIIPVVIEDCKIPYRLYPLQHIDAKKWSNVQIANAIIADISKRLKTTEPSYKISADATEQLRIPEANYSIALAKDDENHALSGHSTDNQETVPDTKELLEPFLVLKDKSDEDDFQAIIWKIWGYDNFSGELLEFEFDGHIIREPAQTQWLTCNIGRDPEQCAFAISNNSISRLHARLNVFPGQGLGIRDLGSNNGTQVAGESVGEDYVILKEGQSISVGDVRLAVAFLHQTEVLFPIP